MRGKRIVASVVMFSMAAAMAMPVTGTYPVTVNAAVTESAEVTEGRCGDNAIFKYDKENKTVTISGTGEMWDDMRIVDYMEEVEHIIIEKGITTIGSYCVNAVERVKSIEIADTVKTIKSYALPTVKGKLVIPASVTKIETAAIAGADTLEFMGDVNGYEPTILGEDYYTTTVILHGDAQDFAAAMTGNGRTVVLATDNKKCKFVNGALLSADEKTLYYYAGSREKVEIPDTVTKIARAAFYNNYIVTEVKLGKNVTEIGAYAFAGSCVSKVTFNSKLKKIGCKAFCYSMLKKVTLPKKVKLGVEAFDNKVKITYKKGVKASQTTITRATLSDGKYTIRYGKVSGAKGYQIKIKEGKKVKKYTTTKLKFKVKASKKMQNSYNVAVSYDLAGNEYLTKPEGAITVSVRPYKISKNKKVYGRWSTSRIVEAY